MNNPMKKEKTKSYRHELPMLMGILDAAFSEMSESPGSDTAQELYRDALDRLELMRRKYSQEEQDERSEDDEKEIA